MSLLLWFVSYFQLFLLLNLSFCFQFLFKTISSREAPAFPSLFLFVILKDGRMMTFWKKGDCSRLKCWSEEKKRQICVRGIVLQCIRTKHNTWISHCPPITKPKPTAYFLLYKRGETITPFLNYLIWVDRKNILLLFVECQGKNPQAVWKISAKDVLAKTERLRIQSSIYQARNNSSLRRVSGDGYSW